MDLLEQGATWLDDQRHRFLARTVVYTRGAESFTLSATVGRTVFEQADEYGVLHPIEARDFIVRAEDLVLSGGPALPKAGDQVRDSVSGAVQVYEAMSPGSEPPWRYSDLYRRSLRIHTKHVGTE